MMSLQSNLSEVAVYPSSCFQGEPTWCCCISNDISGFTELSWTIACGKTRRFSPPLLPFAIHTPYKEQFTQTIYLL
ncbi:hypothetical protein QN277_014456 [Acacia crassicarpa]|uniref:Uncharacterized protein n=1 Tax=Acacia crassicarpa TaxID=499986 RepID=A0AAE1MAN2_9FABA|nr:hypothetical protein QN277_014456 [Acacia crassicarpa]